MDRHHVRKSLLIDKQGVVSNDLQADLDKLEKAHVPVDLFFEQAIDILG